MTDTWDRTLFDKDLKAILESKLPVSASKITGLQSLATAHPKHHNYIVQCITRFIETAPPDYRLAGLYVIDAISRAVHKQQRKREENNEGPHEADGYLKRFAIVLKDDSLIGCFEPCTSKDKDKVKKTLDFWEQGSVYSKDVVQYVKRSFLNSRSMHDSGIKQQEKVTSQPPVDTALLLATLSNIGNGSLANLNIPGLVPATTTAAAPEPVPAVPDALPPALAKLLGGLVSAPEVAAVTSSPSPPSDPRMRNDPRQRSNWPPPQGPSIPNPAVRASGERKSRWGSVNEAPQQPQDPWLQRQNIQDPRVANNNNYQAPLPVQPTATATTTTTIKPQYQPAPYQTPQPVYQQQSYQPPQQQQSYQPPQQQSYQPQQQSYQPPQQQQSYQPQQYQPQPSYQSPQHQPQQSHQQQYQPRSNIKGADPVSDPSLPPGCIKVLTRTLFVGPIPDDYEKEDVAHLFSKYGELASVIVSKKLKGRHNAFLKFLTRASTEAAKYGSAGLVVEDVPVKVNWAFGFGPKKHFNYDRGDSIIPLAELSHEEKDNLMTAPVGGFQGQPVREFMTVEEPEAQYRPEWKNADDNNQPARTGAFKRQGPSGANFEEINSSRKRGRFSGGGGGGNHDDYASRSPPSRYNDQQNSPIRNGGRGQAFYQQQQYDPSIHVNHYSDHQQ
ncbi:hypothetical protein MFLAVUS_000851 [Mucor flavus]|uniref:Uncharacterized protein n=1 Tax=Mucor flavus TaxID=439312 RepID=A0ABP9YKU6_9FUNG